MQAPHVSHLQVKVNFLLLLNFPGHHPNSPSVLPTPSKPVTVSIRPPSPTTKANEDIEVQVKFDLSSVIIYQTNKRLLKETHNNKSNYL